MVLTITLQEITKLVHSAGTATPGFLDAEGCPAMRMLFSTWHRGPGTHLFSACPGAVHVQALQQNGAACLYYHDDTAAVCFSGRVTVHSDHAYKALLWREGTKNTILAASTTRTAACWNLQPSGQGPAALTAWMT